jgi:hypothetical protein
MPGFNIGAGGGFREPSITVEPNRAHRWRIESLGDGQIARATKVYAKSLQLPGYSIEEEIINGAAVKYKFAKIVNWEDVTISFYDVADPNLINDLLEWEREVYTSGRGIRDANDYKKKCSFVLTNGQGDIVGPAFTLFNSWPKSVTHSALSYDNSEFKLVNLTLSYDWAEIGTTT